MEHSDASWNAALFAFSEESSAFCKTINDEVARSYAVSYAEMIGQRLKGLEALPPKVNHQLFAPSRRLICSTIEEMCEKYFPHSSQNIRS